MLEVHRTLEVPEERDLPPLPHYVRRPHDRLLGRAIEGARAGTSSMVVLIGDSSTGKTRALWEAVQGLPAEWGVWHPIVPTPVVAAASGLPEVEPRTVVWLNQAERYFFAEPVIGGPSVSGETIAGQLHELLAETRRGPVLVLATLWTESWSVLTTEPEGVGADPYRESRTLLTDIAVSTHVPPAFSDEEMVRLQELTRTDPRLAQAARDAEDRQVIQFLAGAPALMDRYRSADPGARALIEAAMDARRLLSGIDLPHTLLTAAAQGYLTDRQWNQLPDDWAEKALRYALRRVRGVPGPLTLVRSRRGAPALEQPSYDLADHLEQYAGKARRGVRVPAALWDALIRLISSHPKPAARFFFLAREARDRGLLRIATCLYTRAIESSAYLMEIGEVGIIHGMFEEEARLLRDAGRIDEAIEWYRCAFDMGSVHSSSYIAWMLEETNRTDEAIDWWKKCANSTESSVAGEKAGNLLEKKGRLEEALAWWQHCSEQHWPGNYYERPHMRALALLAKMGRVGDAMSWWLHYEGGSRHEIDDVEGSAQEASGILAEAGCAEAAISWLHTHRTCVADNRLDVMLDSLQLRIEWSSRSAEFDSTGSATGADGIETRGESSSAANSAERPQPRQPQDVDLHESIIRRINAYIWSEDINCIIQVTELAAGADEAEECLRRSGYNGARFDTGDSELDILYVSTALWMAGRGEEAVRWWKFLGEFSRTRIARLATKLLEDTGRANEAILCVQARAEVGDTHAVADAVRLLTEAGRTEEVLAWLPTCAVTGNRVALPMMVQVLRGTGRAADAEKLERYGWEPDGLPAERWEAVPPAPGLLA
ncbi:tetratricopeptide repeat protein [Streptomyces sp. S.PB5]|uniref:tetratricopeptide repeat protein n=1 Tax=Streptomyces sp. S.PB5 TaxID=3020844 RepID=UPI0025B09968|nr:tetratricopeptide repeat protein [Streptomyces sp. S.PB5]MDN3028608.1 tetratricopeptide repeat protein [Streptomyces sp. S.PB5]